MPAKGKRDAAASYNAPKSHGGRRYTGMKVGGRHSWDYDAGKWKETKVAPDRWEFVYDVPKRRRGKAPEGSGAPVGTEYDWLVVAHQVVEKLDANTYSTRMEGLKYKFAHRRAGAEEWSVKTAKGREKRLLAILEDAAERLREEMSAQEPKGASKAKARSVAARHGSAEEAEA